MSLIEVKNVTKRYHQGDETITPLDGVSLNIKQGEFLSLMGASGTGKSTLLNLIASIDKPDSGSIVIDGIEITRLSRTKLANWRAANMGYIFQTHNLVPVQVFTNNCRESMLLSIAGGVIGVAAAMIMLKLSSLSVGAEAVTIAFTPSVRLAVTGLIVSAIAGTLAGIAPVIHASRTEIVPALRQA